MALFKKLCATFGHANRSESGEHVRQTHDVRAPIVFFLLFLPLFQGAASFPRHTRRGAMQPPAISMEILVAGQMYPVVKC